MYTRHQDSELDLAISKTHCDWVVEQATMLKSLLNYGVRVSSINKNRALSTISTIEDSLRELRLYFDEL